MDRKTPDLATMRRLLHAHDWVRLDDWVGAVRALADLDDATIQALVEAISDTEAPASNPRRGGDAGGRDRRLLR